MIPTSNLSSPAANSATSTTALPPQKKRMIVDDDDSDDEDMPLAQALAAKSSGALKPPAGDAGNGYGEANSISNEEGPDPNASGSDSDDDDDDDNDDDDAPLRPSTFTSKQEVDDEEASSDDDRPLAGRVNASSVVSPAVGAPATVKRKAVIDDDSDEDDDDDSDVPLAARKSAPVKPSKPVAKKPVIAADDDSDSDVPLSKRIGSSSNSLNNGKTKKPAQTKKPVVSTKKRAAVSDDDDDDTESDDSDAPLATKVAAAKKQKLAAGAKAKSIASVASKKSAKPATSKTVKAPASTNGTPKKRKKDNEEETEVFRWWEQDLDGSVKWSTLEHNGVLFPPDYKPHGVRMKYDGKEVKLSPASEEVAGFFAQLVGTQYAENATFCTNFFADFRSTLKQHDPDCPIKEFAKCDFTPMTEYFARDREQKKNASKAEKERVKAEKAEIDAKYGYAIIDGRKEKVGNFRIEPPGLFRGRGDHPKTGTLKLRVMPEQVTINIGQGAPIPPPPAGHKWGGIVHDNTVAWLATWTENVNNNIKYVLFAAGSSLKGMSDLKKFEKARELKKHIERLRRDYTAELKDKQMMVRQRATTMWLIDKLALRAGNEKGEDEADTVGCCSLRYEHVQLEEDVEMVPDPDHPGQKKEITKKMVVFDFLGKDSIRYYNRVEVDPIVWKNLKIFKREPKKDGDPLFDRLSTQLLNKHLQTLMPGLTAKVFRTFNASHTFQEELKKPMGTSVAEKVLAYNRANRQVAILCNHQRTVSKGHGAQMERLTDKILNMKYERMLVKKALLKHDPKLKKKRPDLADPESDMDDDTIAAQATAYREREQEKLEKKYEKMCAKAKEEGQPKPAKPKLAGDVTKEKEGMGVERLEKQLESLNARIEQAKTNRVDKDENKTTALGTSKINYIDPRITAAWCAKHDVPVEKMFNRSLREKFTWAMTVDADWHF